MIEVIVRDHEGKPVQQPNSREYPPAALDAMARAIINTYNKEVHK